MARILVVDDESGIRAFVADVLEASGHEVAQAGDGSAALRELEDRPFDLVLVDVRMPGEVDGMGVVRRARAEWPDTQVIVLTAFGTVSTAVEAMRLGAFDFIEKPLAGPDALRRLAARALAWRGATPPRRVQHAGPARPDAPETAPARGGRGGAATLRGLLRELRRRRVYNVAVTYLAAGYVGLEGAQLVLPALPLPEWSYPALVALAVAGLPLALALGWVYDLTLTRTRDAGAAGD